MKLWLWRLLPFWYNAVQLSWKPTEVSEGMCLLRLREMKSTPSYNPGSTQAELKRERECSFNISVEF